jgi:hypothetical protein
MDTQRNSKLGFHHSSSSPTQREKVLMPNFDVRKVCKEEGDPEE